ncbi:MAG: ABC transporter ATP-binding protein, partial [Deltaproteobacteria bacterium]|nr:ABC transporter ATP-binding protein [Deltaproteobacteria bacterium]
MAEIAVSDLSFAYRPGREVLSNVSAVFRPGEAVNILGPNGCGKTTLLKLILGLISPPPGRVVVAGRPAESFSRRRLAQLMAYVPQNHSGVFPFKALEAVMMGRLARGPWWRYRPEDRLRAQAALERVRLAHLADRSCLELSGGERQLVLVARALAQQAEFLIMDEPVANLDYG